MYVCPMHCQMPVILGASIHEMPISIMIKTPDEFPTPQGMEPSPLLHSHGESGFYELPHAAGTHHSA